jgi:uncharacterized membrane protein
MDDRRLENMVGQLLRAGVMLSAAVVTLGGILYLFRSYAAPVNFRSFVAGGPDMRTVGGILKSAAQFRSEGLIQAGLVLLILTPVARVALAVVGFALERDRLYTVVSLIVLVILMCSLLHAV